MDNSAASSQFDVAQMPESDRGKPTVLVVSSVALAFITFWQAAAIVLCDMASTSYYICGISERSIGKAAPWFILAVMLFSYPVCAVYMESCSMFTRGGVYKVVKKAMGGTLAKLSVSALMFDYVLTGPISGVSAGQYLVGMLAQLGSHIFFHTDFDAERNKLIVDRLSMLIAIGVTIYFWRANLIGIGESSEKALTIMKLTTIMGVLMFAWCGLTFLLRPEVRHLPPVTPIFTNESKGWLHNLHIVGVFGIVLAFGHSLLGMSGQESLAQVNREIEAPKLKNLKRAGLTIFLYSMILTSCISLFAVMIIPDRERMVTSVRLGDKTTIVDYVTRAPGADGREHQFAVTGDSRRELPDDAEVIRDSGKYTDNLIGGLAMNMVGPHAARLALQAFVVIVGFLILSGAVNTSIVGSNGVLNRLAEDGVLTPWFQKPHWKFGTTHRLINLVAGLQIFTILASRGDVYALGEAYAFGVVWSFVFMTLSMMVLRFQDRSPRQFRVPLNITATIGGRPMSIPIGICLVFLILFSTAVINLLTKKVATVWGLWFTAGLLIVFSVCEFLSHRRRGGHDHEHLEQFNEKNSQTITAETLGLTHPDPVVVAARGPRSLPVLEKILQETDTNRRDIVVITCKVLPPMTAGVTEHETSINDEDRDLLTKVVTVAEKVGKQVYPVVLPTNNPLYAIATAARDLRSNEVVLGVSEKVYVETQLEQFAMAWGTATAEPEYANIFDRMTVRVVGPLIELKQSMS